ncbi:hypothetical protein [Curtobacterium flaccumfaciens]|uniref:hypothetical protein n=1 Tax=Curtobacterium flaccumfaciens TaxID=2035 RepID=UPI003749CFEF
MTRKRHGSKLMGTRRGCLEITPSLMSVPAPLAMRTSRGEANEQPPKGGRKHRQSDEETPGEN